MQTRRQFVASLPALLVATSILARRDVARAVALSDHPTPRPGITAAKVLTRKQLGDEHADAAPVFDLVRQIPHVVDGIRCRCGCAELEGNYSLLSCYEGDGMAGHCEVCQGEARLAYRLHKQGKSLNEIRAAIDAKFG
ncbi:MAG TPA: PCYCGC motif-containing (lipo)protein [Gemmatimonadaceae bacterium]|jgi:hypothetical protein|nr:PCYCGC motif-containing (lipo)protein [Gemmatimonadaceae bacterium]